ncbi:ABC transporter ATP-binding protein [Halocola ammonii]
MRKFWDIFALVGGYKGYLAMNVIFNILNAILSLFTFLAIVPFLRILFSEATEPASPPSPDLSKWSGDYWMQLASYKLDEQIAQHGRLDMLMYMCLFIITMALLKNLVLYFSLFSLSTIRVGVVRDLRRKLYRKVVMLPLSYYSEERKGDILSRMTNDVMEIEFSVIGTLEILFKSPIMLIAYLGTLFFMSWELTLFALIFLPFSGYIISRMAKGLKNAAGRGKSKLGELISVLEETLTGLRIIKAFNGEKIFKEKFERTNNQYFRLMIKLYKREYLASPFSEFVGISVVAILLWYGGRLVILGDSGLDGNFFIGYLVVFSQILPPAKSFSDAIFRINKGGASIDRINSILHADVRIEDKPDALSIESFKDKIEFEDIHFSYDGKEEVIKGISFSLKKGETVALVGPSGGGKSTIANLIGRFYDINSGSIKIDGHDLRDYKLSSVRDLMGIVTQQSILFNDTVRSNITLGLPLRNPEDVEKAARVANAHEFVSELPGGYNFNIGDNGDKLSGGQKQRLSIARAVFKNPPILVLDEATSALDTRSEILVQEAINNLMKNRTSLVIAHRLSTIQNADKIIVIMDGKIAEMGTHDELMAKKGSYHSLVELQNFD